MPVDSKITRDSNQNFVFSMNTKEKNRIITQHNDTLILSELDPRFYTADFDPIPSVLEGINMDIDFSLPLAERIRKAFADTSVSINASDLHLPPPPSFFEEGGDMTEQQMKTLESLGPGPLSHHSTGLENSLQKLEKVRLTVGHVLGQRVLAHSSRFLSGLTQVTRVAQEVVKASTVATEARSQLALARRNIGANAVAMAARERARARAEAVLSILQGISHLRNCERQAREYMDNSDISSAIDIITNTKTWLNSDVRADVFQEIESITPCVERMDKSENMVVDSCQTIIAKCVLGETTIQDISRSLRALVMRGAAHSVGDLVGRSVRDVCKEQILLTIGDRLDSVVARSGLNIGVGSESDRIGRKLEIHHIKDVVLTIVDYCNIGMKVLRSLEDDLCVMVVAYTLVVDKEVAFHESEPVKTIATTPVSNSKKNNRNQNANTNANDNLSVPTPLSTPHRSRHQSKPKRNRIVSGYIDPERPWAAELTMSDLCSSFLSHSQPSLPTAFDTYLTNTNTNTNTNTSSSSSSSSFVPSFIMRVETARGAIEDLKLSLSQLHEHKVLLISDIVATLCSVLDCKRVGGKGLGLLADDVSVLTGVIYQLVRVVAGLVQRGERGEVDSDSNTNTNTNTDTNTNTNTNDSPTTVFPRIKISDTDDLSSFLNDDPALPSQKTAPSLIKHSSVYRTYSLTSFERKLITLTRKLSSTMIMRVKEYVGNLMTFNVELVTTNIHADAWKLLPVKSNFDLFEHLQELKRNPAIGSRNSEGVEGDNIEQLIAVSEGADDGDGEGEGESEGEGVKNALVKELGNCILDIEQLELDIDSNTTNTNSNSHTNTNTNINLNLNTSHHSHAFNHDYYNLALSVVSPLAYHKDDNRLYKPSFTTLPPLTPHSNSTTAVGANTPQDIYLANAELSVALLVTALSDPTVHSFTMSSMSIIRAIARILTTSVEMKALQPRTSEVISTMVRLYVYNITTLFSGKEYVPLLDSPNHNARVVASAYSNTPKKTENSSTSRFTSKFKWRSSKEDEKTAENNNNITRTTVAPDAVYTPIPPEAFLPQHLQSPKNNREMDSESVSLPVPFVSLHATPSQRMPWLSDLLRGVKHDVEAGTFADGNFSSLSRAFLEASKAAKEAKESGGSMLSSSMSNLSNMSNLEPLFEDKEKEKNVSATSKFFTGFNSSLKKMKDLPGEAVSGAVNTVSHVSSATMSTLSHASNMITNSNSNANTNSGILPPPILGELLPMIDLESSEYAFGFIERINAVRSIFTLAHSLYVLVKKHQHLLPKEQYSSLTNLCLYVYGWGRDLAVLLTNVIGKRIAKFTQIEYYIKREKWDVADLALTYHPYVNSVTKAVEDIKSKTTSSPILVPVWGEVGRHITLTMLEAISNVNSWTVEGRSALVLDVSMIKVALENQLEAKPVPDMHVVNEFVSAYHYPHIEFLSWVKDRAPRLGLRRKEIVGLAWSGPSNELDKSKRNMYITSVLNTCDDNEQREITSTSRFKVLAHTYRLDCIDEIYKQLYKNDELGTSSSDSAGSNTTLDKDEFNIDDIISKMDKVDFNNDDDMP